MRTPAGRMDAVREAVAGLPRVKLGVLPTPLEECERFSRRLSGPRVFIKRDDLSGLAFGGNKTRKLEFYMGEALAHGAAAVVTGAAAQSNHCRQTAAAAARLGLRAVLVLKGLADAERQGNLLLDELLGAEVRLVPVEDFAAVRRLIREVGEDLRRSGVPVYDFTGLEPVGMAGYVVCALELATQFEEQGISPDHIYVCSGTGTQAGLLVGARALGWKMRITGVSPSERADAVVDRLHRTANELAAILGLDLSIAREDVVNTDEYIGPGYGIVTAAGVEAIRLLAESEGILLDPIYSGKAMAALIDAVRKGRIGREHTVVFIHTGGTPGLFAYARELTGFLRSGGR